MVKTETKPLDSEELVLNRLQELVNFRKELVTPMVTYLASEACEPTHEIFGVAAGRFARIGIITHEGYVNTQATAEDIASNIEEIRTITDGSYPLSNEDELMLIQKAIQGN